MIHRRRSGDASRDGVRTNLQEPNGPTAHVNDAVSRHSLYY